MLVHFPIALLFTSVALDLSGYLLAQTSLTRAGFYLLLLGVAGAGVSVLTGPDHATGSAAADALLIMHQNFALLTVALGGSLLIVRFFAADGIGGPWALLYLAVSLVMLAMLALTGYFGGELTYHHGAGVDISAGPVIVPSGPITDVNMLVKPLVALMGLVTVALMGGWLLLGKQLAPHYYAHWTAAVRSERANAPSRLWTLQRHPFAPRMARTQQETHDAATSS
jgi:uncharacterized membrane protein